MSARVVEKPRFKGATRRNQLAYLAPRTRHDEFCTRTFYQSIIITKTIELASRSSSARWIENKPSRRACSAGRCTVQPGK